MSIRQVYQNGLYLMLSLFIGVLFTFCVIEDKHTNVAMAEVVEDTPVFYTQSSETQKELTEENLKEELCRHNIPHADIVLAQAKLESGNFKSELVKSHQNIFGLRKGSEYRRYDHWTECVLDYKKYISSKYTGGDYYIFLNRIGYATHPEYINRLKALV